MDNNNSISDKKINKHCMYFLEKKNRHCLNTTQNQYCSKHHNIVNTMGKKSHKVFIKTDQLGGFNMNKNQYISPYALISSESAPSSSQQSWYHYQAPIYQNFGDYVCIKKSFLTDTKNLFNDMFLVKNN